MPTKLLSLPTEPLKFHNINFGRGFSTRRRPPNAKYFVVKMSSNGKLSEINHTI